MASSKDILEMNEHGNLSRRPLFKVLGATGFGWLFGKLMAREVHAKVGNAYPRVMPSVKTSFNHHSVYPEINPTADVQYIYWPRSSGTFTWASGSWRPPMPPSGGMSVHPSMWETIRMYKVDV